MPGVEEEIMMIIGSWMIVGSIILGIVRGSKDDPIDHAGNE